MKRAVVWLDGRIIFAADAAIHEWKKTFHVASLGDQPGRHELLIAVINQNGHPALIAYCEPLGLATGEIGRRLLTGRPGRPRCPFVPGNSLWSATGITI